MFDIQGDSIKLNIDDMAIPPFKEHYNNSKNKAKALKEIEYVIWLYKWNTPYEAYPRSLRLSVVAKDVFKDENYKPTKEVEQLILRFIELLETTATRLLTTSKNAADALNETLIEYSKETVDIDTALKITRILKDVGNVVKSLDVAMKQAKAELSEQGRVKGGGTIGLYER